MLREDQIQRYSRQILLRAVGGRGQERLLSTPVAIEGEGAAFAVAAAYLAAGGTPLHWNDRDVIESEVGFLFSREDVGRPADPEKFSAQNPDAVPLAPPALTLSGSHGELRLCGEAEGARVLARAKEACADCLEQAATQAPIPGELATAAGAFAALVSQRIALGGFGPGVRGWRLGRSGSLSEFNVEPCARCASTPPP